MDRKQRLAEIAAADAAARRRVGTDPGVPLPDDVDADMYDRLNDRDDWGGVPFDAFDGQ